MLGLHLRLKDSISSLAREASSYAIPIFQFFLTTQKDGKYIPISRDDYKEFNHLRQSFDPALFIHSSYWINPSSGNKACLNSSKKLLTKEIKTANRLDIPYLVLHPGSAKGFTGAQKDYKQAGITTLADTLNSVLKHEPNIKILLENTAHGNYSIGSDLTDFAKLYQYLDKPEQVGFCLDFAHAYAYGYDISKVDEFVAFVEQNMPLEHIKLIHLNDTNETHGSQKDSHAAPGEGKIGSTILKQYLKHEKLKTIPRIVEAPVMSETDTQKLLKTLYKW